MGSVHAVRQLPGPAHLPQDQQNSDALPVLVHDRLSVNNESLVLPCRAQEYQLLPVEALAPHKHFPDALIIPTILEGVLQRRAWKHARTDYLPGQGVRIDHLQTMIQEDQAIGYGAYRRLQKLVGGVELDRDRPH